MTGTLPPNRYECERTAYPQTRLLTWREWTNQSNRVLLEANRSLHSPSDLLERAHLQGIRFEEKRVALVCLPLTTADSCFPSPTPKGANTEGSVLLMNHRHTKWIRKVTRMR